MAIKTVVAEEERNPIRKLNELHSSSISQITNSNNYTPNFLRAFIYGAFVFRKFLCPSFKANVRRFLHQKKRNFISFPTVSITLLLSGFIQQQFSFFWYHPIWEISRIHEKCANCVLLHSKSLQNFLSNSSFPPFLWSEFRKCIINKWSEEVLHNVHEQLSSDFLKYSACTLGSGIQDRALISDRGQLLLKK